MSAWYTNGDSVIGGGVLVVPPSGWPRLSGGRPAGRDPSGGWSVGGTVYRTWEDAWRGAVRPTGWRDGRRVPTASAYLRAWSVDPALGLGELLEVLVTQPPSTGVALGIDLSRRGVEVRRLLHAGFGIRMARAGYDPEDVLQEVYRGILVRNRGKCPFDVRKSSFGHYVHMVIECVLSNYHRRESRHRTAESSWEDMPEGRREAASDGVGDVGARDAVGWVSPMVDGETDAMALSALTDRVRWALADGDVTEREAVLALGVLPLVQAGHAPTSRGARECGWSASDWRDGVAALRRVMRPT
jgi:DNA-directed RNA polymerase specialized sigma24 family protein